MADALEITDDLRLLIPDISSINIYTEGKAGENLIKLKTHDSIKVFPDDEYAGIVKVIESDRSISKNGLDYLDVYRDIRNEINRDINNKSGAHYDALLRYGFIPDSLLHDYQIRFLKELNHQILIFDALIEQEIAFYVVGSMFAPSLSGDHPLMESLSIGYNPRLGKIFDKKQLMINLSDT